MNNFVIIYSILTVITFLSVLIGWRVIHNISINKWTIDDWISIIFVSLITPAGIIATGYWWWELAKNYNKN